MSLEESSSSVELQLKVADLEAEMSRLQRRLVSVQQKVKVEHRQDHASSKRSPSRSNNSNNNNTRVPTTTTKLRKTDPLSSKSVAAAPPKSSSAPPPLKKRASSKKQGNPQRIVRRPNKSRQASVGPKVLSQLQSTRQLKLKRSSTTTKNRLSLLSAIRQRFFWNTMNLTRVQAIEQAPSIVRPKTKNVTTEKFAARPKPKTPAPVPAPASTKRRADVVVLPPRTRIIQQTAPPPPPERRPQLLKRLQGNLRLDVPKSPRTTLQQKRHKQCPRPPARHDTPALACLAAQSKSNSNTGGRGPPQIIQVARQPIPPLAVVGTSEPPPASSPRYVMPSVEPVHNSRTKGIWRKQQKTPVQPKEPPATTTTTTTNTATWKKPQVPSTTKTTARPPPRLQPNALLADIRKTPKLTSTTSSTTAKVGTVHKTDAHLHATTKKAEPPLRGGGTMTTADIIHAAPKLKPTRTKVGNVVTSSAVHHNTNESMYAVSAKQEEPSFGGARSHMNDNMVSTMTHTIRNAPKLNSVRIKVGSATSSAVNSSKTNETREPPSGGDRSNNVSSMVSMLKNGGNTNSSPRRDPPPQRKPDPPAKERSCIHVQSFVQGADEPVADCPTEMMTTTSQPRGRLDVYQQQQQPSIVKKWNRFASMETKGVCAAPRLQTKVLAHQTTDADQQTSRRQPPAPPKAKPQEPRTEMPARSNLLAEIRQKDVQLKSVDRDVDTPSRTHNTAPPVVDLFAGIRAGVALKKVDEADKGPAQEKVSHGSALLAKLQARKAQITNQQQGHQVKPAVVPVKSAAEAKPGRTNDTAPPVVDLFAGIRAGVALKKVQETEKTANKAPNTQNKVTHSSTLLAKLQARKKECMKRSGTPMEDEW